MTQFTDTDSALIYDSIMDRVSMGTNEPLYPGDERRIYAETIAQILVGVHNTINDTAMQRMLDYARGEKLDGLGAWMGVERLAATPASAMFKFHVDVAQAEDIEIPEGTRITSDGVTYFATDEMVVLRAGEAYVEVMGTCATSGAAYNGIEIGKINVVVDLKPYISKAENITVTDGGDDGEPCTEEGDSRYRERIRLAPAAFSTAGSEDAYRYHILSALGNVADVYVVSPIPCAIDIYTIMVDGSFATDAEKKIMLEAVNKRSVRPTGDQVAIKDPEIVNYDIELKYFTTADKEKMAVVQVESEGGAIDQYNIWQQETLGRHIVPDALRRLIYSAKDGEEFYIERTEIVSPAYTELKPNQVAHWSGKLTVSHEVLEDYK